jgi:hypothetical protein
MRRMRASTALGMALAFLALTGCGGSSGAPATASSMQAPSEAVGNDAAIHNISGQYAGTVKDSRHGKGRITALLAQYKNAVGGSLTVSAGTTSIMSSDVWSLSNGTELTGSGATTIMQTTCVYSINGKYDTTTYQLSGSYHAVHGCSGQNGTYTMKQKCYYARDWAIRREAGPRQC